MSLNISILFYIHKRSGSHLYQDVSRFVVEVIHFRTRQWIWR